MSIDAVRSLRAQGFDVTTVAEQGLRGRSDLDQLSIAKGMQRIIVSANIRDFAGLHTRLIRAGEHHCGIVLVRQGQFGMAETIRRLARIASELEHAEMEDRMEYLTTWEPLND